MASVYLNYALKSSDQFLSSRGVKTFMDGAFVILSGSLFLDQALAIQTENECLRTLEMESLMNDVVAVCPATGSMLSIICHF